MASGETFWRDLDKQFRERLTAYVNSLLLRILRRSENPGYSEDIINETFREAYRDFHSFDARRGKLEAWLFGIARNQTYMFLRTHRELKSERSFSEVGFDMVTAPQDGPELTYACDAIGNPKTRALRKALKQLARYDQELLICYYGNRLSYEEMERYFNYAVKRETLRVHVSRAKARLSKALAKLPEFADMAKE